MQNRDTFQRQTGPLSQARTGQTAPLRGDGSGTRPLVSPEALRASTEGILSKGRQSIANLQPRMELLLAACLASKVPVPGVVMPDAPASLSPKGEQLLNYLHSAFREKPALARQVSVAVFRTQEAERAVARAETALAGETLVPSVLEDLKLKLFYLTRLHEEFKDDPVLRQLFPPPQTATLAGAPAGPPAGASPQQTTVERLRLKAQREAILHKAEILASQLAPRMDTLAMTLAMIETPKLNVGALFSPATRTARLLSIGLIGEDEVIEQLRETHRLFERLQGQLQVARDGGDVTPLKETIYPLSRLALACRQHPLLKDLFPFGEDALFPEDEPPA